MTEYNDEYRADKELAKELKALNIPEDQKKHLLFLAVEALTDASREGYSAGYSAGCRDTEIEIEEKSDME